MQSHAVSLNVRAGAGFFPRKSERCAEYPDLTCDCQGRCE